MLIPRDRILHVHRCLFAPPGSIGTPVDAFSERIRKNVLASADEFAQTEISPSIPFLPDSPLPYHNLYLAFYTGMQAACILPQEALAYRLSGERRYFDASVRWLDGILGWDTDLFSFYIAARLMHALLCTVDWLRDDLDEERLDAVTRLIDHMCLFREEEALAMCRSNEPGGHANLYVAGFGLCCLYLKTVQPKAERWFSEVLDKYQRCLLPRDWSPDGSYPPDGTWCYTYAAFYKFAFLDAYKAACGRDLIAQYKEALSYPVRFLKHAYLGGETIPYRERYTDHENMAAKGYNLDAFSPVCLRFAALTQDPYLQWIATRDPRAGSIITYPNKVKQGPRFIYNPGLLAWFWYDPSLKPDSTPPEEASALFPNGELAILRTGFGPSDLILSYQGRRGNIMYESPGFCVNRLDHNFFAAAPSLNCTPCLEENALAVSGEMERRGVIRKLRCGKEADVLTVDGFLTSQSIVMDKVRRRIQIHAVGKEPSSKRLSIQEGYVSLDGAYLQYPLKLDMRAGRLTMRFRLKRTPSRRFEKPSILFSAGQHLRYSFGHGMFFGFLEDGCLGVKFKDAENRCLFAQFPRSMPPLIRDGWYDVALWWEGLNAAGQTPRLGMRIGDMEIQTSLDMPRGKAFVCVPNTSMWIGGGVEMPDSFAAADIAFCELFDREGVSCFKADYSLGLDAPGAPEQSRGPMEYRLHLPVTEQRDACMDGESVVVHNGGQTLRLTSSTCAFSIRVLPYAQTGFAAESFERVPASYKCVCVHPNPSKPRVIDFSME